MAISNEDIREFEQGVLIGAIVGGVAAYMWARNEILTRDALINGGVSKDSERIQALDKTINTKSGICVAIGILGFTLPTIAVKLNERFGLIGK